jgi:hypothetical protein
MKLERGGLHAKKIEGADAFGFYERTPSLPYAANEDPGSNFIPSPMDGEEGQPRPTKGIFVAMMVMNCTFASRGRLAM